MKLESDKRLQDYSEKQRRYWLYVLKLENDKYYVGITARTPEIRFKQHQNDFLGAKWTKLYKPISIYDRKDLGLMTIDRAQKAENKVVRMYMNKYGYNNVRGGDISSVGKLVKRFGYYFDAEGWKDAWVISFLVVAIIIFAVPRYIDFLNWFNLWMKKL